MNYNEILDICPVRLLVWLIRILKVVLDGTLKKVVRNLLSVLCRFWSKVSFFILKANPSTTMSVLL